jgi:hypothetical protein
VVVTVPMVGNPLKRIPLDPFAILLVSAGLAAVTAGRHRPSSSRVRRARSAVTGRAGGDDPSELP